MDIAALAHRLPEGRQGKMLALGLFLAAILLASSGVAAPLIGWYQARALWLARHRSVALHMEVLAETLPLLRRQANNQKETSSRANFVPGSSDALAAASLQGLIQEVANRIGAHLSSVVILPGKPVGRWRRIGLKLAVSASYSIAIRLLSGLTDARPVMMIDDLSFTGWSLGIPGRPTAMNVSFTVYAFRRVAGPQSRPVEQQARAQ